MSNINYQSIMDKLNKQEKPVVENNTLEEAYAIIDAFIDGKLPNSDIQCDKRDKVVAFGIISDHKVKLALFISPAANFITINESTHPEKISSEDAKNLAEIFKNLLKRSRNERMSKAEQNMQGVPATQEFVDEFADLLHTIANNMDSYTYSWMGSTMAIRNKQTKHVECVIFNDGQLKADMKLDFNSPCQIIDNPEAESAINTLMDRIKESQPNDITDFIADSLKLF